MVLQIYFRLYRSVILRDHSVIRKMVLMKVVVILVFVALMQVDLHICNRLLYV